MRPTPCGTTSRGALLPFWAKQCVTTDGGYDFGKAETRLLDLLARVPALDLEVSAFTFSHEQHLTGGLAPLKAKVAQEALPRDAADAIRRELGPQGARAQRVLELLETVASFLAATGGSLAATLDAVGDLSLHGYVKSVLLLDDAVDLGRAVATLVKLKHVASLWTLLTDVTEVDPFAKVMPKYREPLLPGQEASLGAFVDALADDDKETLRSIVKQYVTGHLCEERSAATSSMGGDLGWVDLPDDSYLVDTALFKPFPTDITMACALAAYRVIEDHV